MISRRRLLEMGAGTAFAAPGWLAASSFAQGKLELSPLLPEGTRSETLLDALPGKKPLIKPNCVRLPGLAHLTGLVAQSDSQRPGTFGCYLLSSAGNFPSLFTHHLKLAPGMRGR
jgi:hypothetical protein